MIDHTDKPVPKHEIAAAREWRLARRLTVQDLSARTGYQIETIYFFERGGRPSQPIRPWVWQRFKTSCSGVEAEIRAGKAFDWGRA